MNQIFEKFLSQIRHKKTGKILEQKKLQRNTWLVPDNPDPNVVITEDQHIDRFYLRLHTSDILHVSREVVIADSCRWRTNVTKDRLHEYLSGTGYGIGCTDGQWRWHQQGGGWKTLAPFTDRDRLNWNGKEFVPEFRTQFSPEEEKIMLRRAVHGYASNLKYKTFPIEESTDCWTCRNYGREQVLVAQPLLPVDFVTGDNANADLELATGQSYRDALICTKHLLVHLETREYPCELIREALRYSNATLPVYKFALADEAAVAVQLSLLPEDTDTEQCLKTLQSAVRKFLKNRLGLNKY